MVILRFLTLFTSLITFAVSAKVPEIICTPKELCADINIKVEELIESDISEEAFLDRVHSIALDNSIRLFQIYTIANEKYYLIEKKSIIQNINIIANEELDIDKILRISQLQEGVFYSEVEVDAAKGKIKEWLEERGYQDILIDIAEKGHARGYVTLDISVKYQGKVTLEKVIVTGQENDITVELMRGLRKGKGKVYSRVQTKLEVDRIVSELKKMGYLNASIEFNEEKLSEEKRNLYLKIFLGVRTQFSFSGNVYLTSEELLIDIKKSLLDGASVLRVEDIAKVIKKSYLALGLYNTKVKFYERVGESVDHSEVKTMFFDISEGKKIRLKSLSFKGNLLLDISTLRNIFYDNANTLASRDFLDENYLDNFSNILKDYYLQRGFVFIDISRPRIIFNKDRSFADVSYTIKERQQSLLAAINLEGIPANQKARVLSELKNQVNRPLNVVELENDLARALNVLRDLGYFYAEIKNLDEDNVVTYDMNFTRSQINLKFNLGKITRFENLVLSGNRITKDIVLTREVKLVKGDTITPQRLKIIQDKINSLGLFARVQVIPIVTNKLSNEEYNKTNVIIQVQEKKFGRGEIAPGYRTDIGAKLSMLLTKSNLFGLNDSGSLKFQVNRRFDLSQFDERRSQSNKHLIEGLSTVSYNFPYLMNFVDFNGNFSVQRRRFYSFDADIFRVSPQFTKQINKYLGATLKYQYESIRQFDATQDKDKATFQIGSLTPGITLDLRDSPVSPRSGAYFGLSWEFANPYFGSQRDEDIEINFSKVISRNRFYIPIVDKTFVLALSMSMGMQENYATGTTLNSSGEEQSVGYIPSIKVFRLDGFDVVRGYSDSEINRLDNGEDITVKRIEGKAFFANFKFEPRYYASDSFVVGPFLDAGRLFIDSFKPLDLRTSVGLTLKFLTPVGTLDFDYGVKLKRRDLDSTGRESFGRFHLSIGYF